jgi:hypothetical protein
MAQDDPDPQACRNFPNLLAKIDSRGGKGQIDHESFGIRSITTMFASMPALTLVPILQIHAQPPLKASSRSA